MIDLDVTLEVTGHKSSEGDGRTAADIRREIEEEAARLRAELLAEGQAGDLPQEDTD